MIGVGIEVVDFVVAGLLFAFAVLLSVVVMIVVVTSQNRMVEYIQNKMIVKKILGLLFL